MAKGTSIPRRRRLASYTGKMMVDVVRGQLRVRKWPAKRGPPKSAKQAFWVDWFKQANFLAKYADPILQVRAMQMAKNSGLYPRDLHLAAMRGRLFTWVDSDGFRWFSMAARGDISESLDVLSQAIGSVLVRAGDFWKAAGPDIPTPGHVLTYQALPSPPAFLAPGAGLAQVDLPGTPFTPDNTVSFYDFDVTAFAEVEITLDTVSLASSQNVYVRCSVDGGASFKTGGSDYTRLYYTNATRLVGNTSLFHTNPGAAASGIRSVFNITGLQTKRAAVHCMGGISTNNPGMFGGLTRFDGPITTLKLLAGGGVFFSGGQINVIGKTSA